MPWSPPRFATVWYDDTAPDPFTPSESAGWLWDSTLGGRVSVLRYGSDPVLHPRAGGEAFVAGSYFSESFARAICRRYRQSDFFCTVEHRTAMPAEPDTDAGAVASGRPVQG